MTVNRSIPIPLAHGLLRLPVPLLATKLGIPQPRPTHVYRTRLSDSLTAMLSATPVAFVWAPAGYGKTALLAQWAANSELPVAWVSLDEDDNDPLRFWSYIIAALQTLNSKLGKRSLSFLQSGGMGRSREFLIDLLNEIDAQEDAITLVLDDYHAIDALSIDEAMFFLLQHVPRKLRIVIISRTLPLSFVRLIAKDRMSILNLTDLSFTLTETTEFFCSVGLPVCAEDIALMRTKTEGWITGLQLMALSLAADNSDPSKLISQLTGSDRLITDYFVAEVLSSQSQDDCEFLLKTSILNRMNAALCAAVLGRDENAAQKTLEHLERNNMFVVGLDDKRQWYRYHQLFAELLREQLRREGASPMSDLYDRAIDWHERNGTIGEAITLALDGGSFDRAAILIEANYFELVRRGEGDLILGWIQRLPLGPTGSSPQLGLAKAWALIGAERLGEAEHCLEEVENAAPDDGSFYADSIRGEAAALHVVVATMRDDVSRIIASAEWALGLVLAEQQMLRGIVKHCLGVAYARTGNLPAARHELVEAMDLLAAVGNLSISHVDQYYLANVGAREGRLHESAQILEGMVTKPQTMAYVELPVAHMAHCTLASILYEWNELEKAEYHANEGIGPNASGWWTKEAFREGYSVLANIRLARGDLSSADTSCRRVVEASAGDYAMPFFTPQAISHLRAFISSGCLHDAVKWAEDLERSYRKDESAEARSPGQLLVAAQVLFAAGKTEPAKRLVEPLLHFPEKSGANRQIIGALLLKCLMQFAGGDAPTAMFALTKALALAEPEGYIRTFIDEGAPMLQLLERAKSLGIAPGYVDRLLASFGGPALGATHRETSLASTLTGREIEILRLAALGQSCREIAKVLIVSPETIKFHLKNIYAKLDSHSRFQAVQRARELGLL